jgi:hypothetical protein
MADTSKTLNTVLLVGGFACLGYVVYRFVKGKQQPQDTQGTAGGVPGTPSTPTTPPQTQPVQPQPTPPAQPQPAPPPEAKPEISYYTYVKTCPRCSANVTIRMWVARDKYHVSSVKCPVCSTLVDQRPGYILEVAGYTLPPKPTSPSPQEIQTVTCYYCGTTVRYYWRPLTQGAKSELTCPMCRRPILRAPSGSQQGFVLLDYKSLPLDIYTKYCPKCATAVRYRLKPIAQGGSWELFCPVCRTSMGRTAWERQGYDVVGYTLPPEKGFKTVWLKGFSP